MAGTGPLSLKAGASFTEVGRAALLVERAVLPWSFCAITQLQIWILHQAALAWRVQPPHILPSKSAPATVFGLLVVLPAVSLHFHQIQQPRRPIRGGFSKVILTVCLLSFQAKI